jgi:hypothetical protein
VKESLQTYYYILTLANFMHNLILGKIIFGGSGSSVSIVSGYELDDRATDVRLPAEAKGFFL